MVQMKRFAMLAIILALLTGCTSSQIAGRFEADVMVDPTTHQITNMHVETTKNYGDIAAEVTIDPKTNIPLFKIKASKVDATSLAAIVAQSNAKIAESVSSGITAGAKTLTGAVIGVPLQ